MAQLSKDKSEQHNCCGNHHHPHDLDAMPIQGGINDLYICPMHPEIDL
jgi:hypothetical protein